MRHGATADARESWRRLVGIAALFATFPVLGWAIVSRIGRPGILNPGGDGVNTFFEQYRRHEPVFLVLMAAFAIATALGARRGPSHEEPESAVWRAGTGWGVGHLMAIAALVLAATTAGTWVVMHAFPLSMDEYVAEFQSRAIAEGHMAVPLPDAWRQFGPALTPVFVVYHPDGNFWLSAYWPAYGALRALFLRFGADRLVNPLLAGLSVLLVYACARRLWPGDKPRAWLAVACLVLSSQFLFMSMTGYAMPAHLAINLLWVYAFARNDRAGWLAAPFVGIIALALHNPFPHALFVAPFLLQLLAWRRWGWTLYFGAVYLAGIAACYAWAQAVTAASAGGSLAGLFASPGLLMLGVQQLSLTVILSWQTPLLAVMLIWTALEWRSLSDVERCLTLGIALSYLFFFLYPSTQGHGWGYRYTYPVLGNMTLLGSLGTSRMAESIGRRQVGRLLISTAVLTLFVQFPVRAWQTERYVRPFAQAHDYVAHIDADVVIVDPTTSWYGIDLIRNDPFLRQKPKILSAYYLGPAEQHALAQRFGDRVHLLQASEIAPFGIPTYPSRFRNPVWPPRVTPPAAPPPGPPASPAAPAPSSPPPRSAPAPATPPPASPDR